MEKTNPVRFLFTSFALALLLFICFFLFYLSRVRFHEPIHILAQGPGSRQLSSIQIYGITPLGRESTVDLHTLSGANGKTLLFSEVLIDLGSVQVDSVSGIMVLYGDQKIMIGPDEIRHWYETNKVHPLLPLSGYAGDRHSTWSKIWSLQHLDMRAYIWSVELAIRFKWEHIRSRLQLVGSDLLSIWQDLFLSIPFLLFTFMLCLLGIVSALMPKYSLWHRIATRLPGFTDRTLFVWLFTLLLLLIYGIGYDRLADTVAGELSHIKPIWADIQWDFLVFVCSFYSTIPFLLLTVVFPSFCILVALVRRPISQQRIVVHQTGLAKSLFFICLFFFILLHTYCIYYYKLRLQGCDSVYDLLFYSYKDGFMPGIPDQLQWRPACVLNIFLLMPGFKLHLPMDTIARVYCLNDAGFHLCISLAILFFTRRYDLAAVVLAAQMLIGGAHFFLIPDEIYLSGSIMILYMAVHKGVKDGALKNLILFPCMFFIVWGHPSMILVLAVFLAGMYRSWAQLSKDKYILLFMLVNTVIKFLSMTQYDLRHIHQLVGGSDLHSLYMVITDYGMIYWHVLVIAIAAMYISYDHDKDLRDYRGLLIFPVLLYFGMSQKIETSVDHGDFEKFFYPVNLFILMQGIVLITRYWDKYRKRVIAGTCIILFSGVFALSTLARNYKKRDTLIETLNTMCIKQDPHQSKWYINDSFLHTIGVGSFDDYGYSEAIPYSSFQKLPLTLQLVIADETTKNVLDTVPEDRYYPFPGDYTFPDIKGLNPYYFHFHPGPYKELILDSAKLGIIRKACGVQ